MRKCRINEGTVLWLVDQVVAILVFVEWPLAGPLQLLRLVLIALLGPDLLPGHFLLKKLNLLELLLVCLLLRGLLLLDRSYLLG